MADFIGGGGLGRVGGGRHRKGAPSNPLAWIPAAFSDAAALFSAASDRYAVPQHGPELIANGDFSGGDTGWTYTNWTFDGLKAAHLAGTSFDLKQTYNFTPHKIVKFAFEVLDRTQGSITPRIHGGTNLIGKQAYTQNGTFAEFFQIVTGNVDSRLRPTSAFDGSIDNVSIRELDTSALQAGSVDDFKANALLPAGLVKNSAGELVWSALGDLPYDYSNGNRQLFLQRAWTNKCQCYKTNPVDTSKMTLGGPNPELAVFDVVDDTAALAAAGLSKVCTSGKVFRLDNSAGTSNAHANPAGSVGAGNTVSGGVYVRGSGEATVGLNIDSSLVTVTLTDDYKFVGFENSTTDPVLGGTLRINAAAGAVMYFIMPGLFQRDVNPLHPIVLETDAAAAVTREADSMVLSELDYALLTRGRGSVVISGTRVNDDFQAVFTVWDGTSDNYIEIRFTSDGNARFGVSSGGVLQAQFSSTGTVAAGERFAIAVRWAENDFAMSLNGEPVVTGTSGAVPVAYTEAVINKRFTGEQFALHYDYFAIYDTLNDAELQSKTAELAGVVGWENVGDVTAQIASTATPGTTQTVNLPADLQENDIVLVAIAADTILDQATANQGVATSGYEQEYATGTGNPGGILLSKRMGSTPDTTVDIYEVDGKRSCAAVKVIRGANTGTLFDVASTVGSGLSASPLPEANTSVTDNALSIAVGFLDDDAVTSVTAPSGYTDLSWTASDGGNPSVADASVMIAI